MMKKLSFLLLACLAFPLASCVEFDEVTQLLPNGGVDFTLTILMPELPDKKVDEKTQDANREIEEIFRTIAGSTKLKDRGEETLYGKQRVWLSASLPSLKSVSDIYAGLGKSKAKEGKQELKKSRDALDNLFSDQNGYRVEKTKQGSLKISRDFKPPKATKAKEKKGEKSSKEAEALSKNMEDMMMNSMTFRFEFFSPTEVLSSNATGKFGQILRWDASLGYLSKNPFKMEMEIASTPELEAALLHK